MTINKPSPLASIARLAALTACMASANANKLIRAAEEQSKPAEAPAAATSTTKPEERKPHDSLAAGYKESLRTRQPVFVRIGGESCPWCHKLEADLQTAAGKTAVQGFTLVAIDADKSPDDARAMGVSAIPALRIVSPAGRVLMSHDGYLPPEELAEWLGAHRDAARAENDEELLAEASEQPTALGIVKIVRHFGDRDPRIREAAIRRLRAHPDVARSLVVKALCEGNLNSQLAALELVAAWKGPIAELDPWRPETMTDARKEALRRWAGEPLPEGTLADAEMPQPLDERQLAAAREDLTRLLAAKPIEVEAICERLSRLGKPLFDEIDVRAKTTEGDEAKHRLLLLRYRILASDALALRWPGGLSRLAAISSDERRKALEELHDLAGPDDLPLLTDLFRESDPLIRELALRTLRQAGGQRATTTLVSLLDDPEPNVRAAVLKLLSETPETSPRYRAESAIELEPELVDKIAKYALAEKDADLVVHAIRVLKGVESPRATATLIDLFKHSSWQARAEAAEAVGKRLDRHGNPSNAEVKSRIALADLLDDPDPFVVSKALESVPGDSAAVIDRMVAVTEKHPSLTLHVIQKMSASEDGSEKVLSHLRSYARHADAGTRAAAIERLVSTTGGELADEEVVRWLSDADTKVRTAAASAIEQARAYRRPSAEASRRGEFPSDADDAFDSPSETRSRPGLLKGVLDFFFKSKPKEDADEEAAPEKPEPPDEKPDSSPLEDLEAIPDAEPVPGEKSVPEDVTESEPSVDEGAPRIGPPGKIEGATDESADELLDKPTVELPGDQDGNEPSPNRLDTWLAASAAGENHPGWAAAALPLLEKMLTATDRDERGAAALALLSLGRVEQGLPPLVKQASDSPADFVRAAQTLTWLPWAQRPAVFEELLGSIEVAPEAYYILVGRLAESKDPRAADLLWEQLADDDAAPKRAEVIGRAVEQCLFGERHYSSTESAQTRRQAMAKLSPRIDSGPPWQRIVALSLLMQRSADDAIEQAEKLAADAVLPEKVRCLAFQIQLTASDEAGRRDLSLAAIADPMACRKRLALTCLTDGTDSLRYLGELGYVYSYRLNEHVYRSSDDLKVILPAAPKGLEARHLISLLADSDPAVKARAGYLLALLGEAQGLEPLIAHWRSSGDTDHSVVRLVYRAIAALDDESQLPILKQIYQQVKDTHEVSDFYWTVRSMTDRSVLDFRGQIRKELGMERLN